MQISQEMDLLRQSKSFGNVERVEVEAQSTYDKDQVDLARTGKKQVFKVRLGPGRAKFEKHSLLRLQL